MRYRRPPREHRRVKVAFVTKARGIGGAEKNLVDFLAGVDQSRFDCALVGLRSTDLTGRVVGYGVDTHVTRASLPAKIVDLRRFLHQWRPDVLHLFGLEANLLGRVLGHMYHPRIVTALLDADPHPPTHYRLLNRATAPLTHYWISNSEAGKALAIAQVGAASDRIYIVRNGIDADHFAPCGDKAVAKRNLGFDPAVPVIVEVANLRPMKGHLDLVQAAPDIIRRGGPVKFLFVGGDLMGGIVQERVEEESLQDQFMFIGKRDDVRPYLAAADIFTLPSHHEGLPTSIMEAMAMQLPIVATRVGGIPELVVDGETGRLVEPNDPRVLANALVSLLADRSERRRLGHAARQRVVERFSIRQMIDGLQSAYTDIAGEM